MLPSLLRLPCNFGAGGDDRRWNTMIILSCVGTTQIQARDRSGSRKDGRLDWPWEENRK